MPARVSPPTDGLLSDRLGRVARDLRVSLTDRCNLRCSYCMPPEGLAWLPDEQTLTDAEVLRLCTIAIGRLGIRKIRFTGGEPLLRPGLAGIIAGCARLITDQGRPPELALTTNGLGLAQHAHRLADAGLQRINVSLDTLDPEHFRQLTHRDRLADVLAGLDAAKAAGLAPIKVNAVVLREVNEQDTPALLDFCLASGIELRFIEQMPIGPARAWHRNRLVTRADLLDLLGRSHRLTPVEQQDPTAPARLWCIDGDPTRRVGIIASVSAPFCASCDRTRLTSDGQLRSCLFATGETDLRTPLRAGAGDQALAGIWRAAMWAKPIAHGLTETAFAVPSRTMSRIGG